MLTPITLEPIKAGQEKLERVFSNDYAFSIPSYQRPYAWEVENAQALLTDVAEAMDHAVASPKEPITYFLGSRLNHIQYATAAAMTTAERKSAASLS